MEMTTTALNDMNNGMGTMNHENSFGSVDSASKPDISSSSSSTTAGGGAFPSPQDLDKLREELAQALDAESATVDKQMSLLQERRNLKVALEDAEMECHLVKLRAEKEKLMATKEMNE